MEAPEVPTEHLHEHLEHAAHEAGGWVSWVAVSTAVIAAIAAIASLLAGMHVNEAIITKMDCNDTWSEFGVKSIKSDIAASKGDEAKVKDYEAKKEKLAEHAKELSEESKHHLHVHEELSGAVTFCQLAIALAAISALTRRKSLWVLSLGLGAVGSFFLITGLMAH